MRSLLILATFVLFAFQATSGQDVDSRMEAFLRDSMTNFPMWMKENDIVPGHIMDGGRFFLRSETEDRYTVYNIIGEIKNRFYHGADKNMKALDIQSSLKNYTFFFDLAFGGDKTDFIEGNYSLHGGIGETSPVPVFGVGNFTKTDLVSGQLHHELNCKVDVTPEGYFKMDYCVGPAHPVTFANLTLKGLNASGQEKNIVPMVNSWYDAQLQNGDFPDTAFQWFKYIAQVFEITPVVDIIGTKLAPTIPSDGNLEKFPIVTKNMQEIIYRY